jgi:hypothetical protein
VTLVKPADNWEVYTSGRVGAFGEFLNGDPFPTGSGASVASEGVDIKSDAANGMSGAGRVSAFRVRSGFLSNVLTLGVRRNLTPSTVVTGQISIWATAETDAQRSYFKNLPDAREGFLKVEGPGGTLLVGRALSLFGRGGTETNFLYGHGYAVGAPGGFTTSGPTGGHIGYGVLGNVFVAGIAYATPPVAGLQLHVGYYDPAVMVGQVYSRTKLGRPEARASFDTPLGATGKLHLFVEGAFQKLYDNVNGTNDSKNVYGGAAGARLEVGPFHLGVSGYSGKGLGVYYFLSQTDSINNKTTSNMRPFDGLYTQAQLVVNKFDLNAGWGITRAHQMTDDLDTSVAQWDYLKSQMGISAVVVYHFSTYLHGAFDYFRSDVRWWGGEKQVIHSLNLGATVTW